MNPKLKKTIKIFLLVFVILCVCYIIDKEYRKTPCSSAIKHEDHVENKVSVAEPQNKKENAHRILAYYFHTTARCPSCHKIENFTREAIYENFNDKLNKGSLEFKMVNVEEVGNDHFVQDYKLYTKSVVLSEQKEGKEIRSKNLSEVWNLLRDKEQFKTYIKKEVADYLSAI